MSPHAAPSAIPAADAALKMSAVFDLTNVAPTPNAVRVLNVSPEATDKAVREFFAFCGKICHFQLITSPTSNDAKEALIVFDRESAANTSLLLTNAVIVDRSIIVRPFFDAHDVRDPMATAEVNERAAAEGRLEGHKPLTRVIAEMLVSGYTLTEPVLRKGVELDQKFSVSKSLSNLLSTAQFHALAINEKYQLSNKIKDIDAKLHISESANAAIAKASEIGTMALHTSAGQKVAETVATAREKVREVTLETRQIVDQQRVAKEASGATSTEESGFDVAAADSYDVGGPSNQKGESSASASKMTSRQASPVQNSSNLNQKAVPVEASPM